MIHEYYIKLHETFHKHPFNILVMTDHDSMRTRRDMEKWF